MKCFPVLMVFTFIVGLLHAQPGSQLGQLRSDPQQQNTLSTPAAGSLSFEALLDSGKAVFQRPFEEQDYEEAAYWLEQAVALSPENAEAHYFLGYAYSRINSKDGGGMVDMNVPLLLKTSAEFEKVIRLQPNYEGEMVLLGPYSKLTSEWGSLAMTFWHNGLQDSCRWAFAEGRQRGGFGTAYLDYHRLLLEDLPAEALLMTSGDNFTFNLWYLQIMEGLRPDVTVLDVNLLNTEWYPDYLLKKSVVPFRIAADSLAKIDHGPWADSTVTIGQHSWTVPPSYYGKYILRGDKVFLQILAAGAIDRPIYFTIACPPTVQLGFEPYLRSQVYAEQVSLAGTDHPPIEEFLKKLEAALRIVAVINPNSYEEMALIDLIRSTAHQRIASELKRDNTQAAIELFALMDRYAGETEYPYHYGATADYARYLRSFLPE